MDNNMTFISSIKSDPDFKELIKQYVELIYNGHAYIVDGPWDNGKDIVYNVGGKEKREAIQITIQEKNIEEKIKSDLEKVHSLVENHAYPPTLTFFWSHPISENKLDQFKTHAKLTHGITLEFFDAKRISQDITKKYPKLLSYLIEKIHNYAPLKYIDSEIDIKQRTFYEYLLLSKDTANLKNSITDAYIISLLQETALDIDRIFDSMKDMRLRKGTLQGRLNTLISSGRVEKTPNGIYQLSAEEKTRITSQTLTDLAKKEELLDIIRKELTSYTEIDLSIKILELVKKAYEESIDVQIKEIEFQPPKTQIINDIIFSIRALLKDKCGLTASQAQCLSERIVEITASNDYLSCHCSAKLCISLLSNHKLERYIEKRRFYIYFDAPVLIPYVVVTSFKNKELFDKSLVNVSVMRDVINSINNKELRVSIEHFEETVRHLEHAYKLSTFVTAELSKELGPSKNVFFNVYLKWKNNQPDSYGFSNFLYSFIGVDEDEKNNFQTYSKYLGDFIEASNINTINYYNDIPDGYLTKVKKELSWEAPNKNRPNQAIDNDIICTAALGDEKLHLDERGELSTPMLITLDSSQYTLRNVVRNIFRNKEWLVYTPQRAIERLSMLSMKISPQSLKEGVLATISDDYFFNNKTKSLMDTLAIIISDSPAGQGDIIKLVTSLKRSLTDEQLDQTQIDIEQYNMISNVLLYTHKEFKSDFEKIVRLFTSTKLKEPLITLLLDTIKSNFDDMKKDAYKQNLTTLLGKLD
ncbi:TPA: hypothetical protein ACNUUR_003076 [Aeromonas salmonicida]